MPYVTTDAGTLYCEDQGSGPAVVFIPGLGGDARAFAVLSRSLSTFARAIAFDPRDAGRSFRASLSYTTRDMARDIAQALDQLGVQQAHVVGHSLGGLVAEELTMARPDLVRSLILASTHAGSNTWRRAVIASWITMRKCSDPAQFATITLPWLVGPEFYHHHAQVEGLIRFAERNEWPQEPEAFERQARAACHHDARGRLRSIEAPTLVIVGEKDLVNPPNIAEELVKEIPSASYAIIPHAGHMPHVEAAANFRSVVTAFIQQHA